MHNSNDYDRGDGSTSGGSEGGGSSGEAKTTRVGSSLVSSSFIFSDEQERARLLFYLRPLRAVLDLLESSVRDDLRHSPLV